MFISLRKLIFAVVLIWGLFSFYYSDSKEKIERDILVIGDFGEDVKQLQIELKKLNNNDLKPTGLFGMDMVKSVKTFQEEHNLEVTGMIDQQTHNLLLIAAREETGEDVVQVLALTNNELTVLAKIIYGEARGEPYSGQIAVGAVIINRVKHPSFPNTVSGVIFEPLAFTAVADGQFYLNPNQEAFKAASDALKGVDPSNGSLYYYNPAKVTSNWIWSRPVVTRIGKHTFAR